jgi:hypothetical protein
MRIQEITYMGARKVVKEMMFPASQKNCAKISVLQKIVNNLKG